MGVGGISVIEVSVLYREPKLLKGLQLHWSHGHLVVCFSALP
mgnify:FL=1